MSNAVIITLIICGTVIALAVVSTVGTVIAAKKASKLHDEIMKDFKEEK